MLSEQLILPPSSAFFPPIEVSVVPVTPLTACIVPPVKHTAAPALAANRTEHFRLFDFLFFIIVLPRPSHADCCPSQVP